MKYVSTRNKGLCVDFTTALQTGLCPQGGLYVPQVYPQFELTGFKSDQTFSAFAKKLLAPFLNEDPLSAHISEICDQAFNFPVPIISYGSVPVLELFHGPTSSFKDIGARFLAECVQRTPRSTAGRKTVLVATSGDTGSAVAGAFFQKQDTDVMVLFPKGKISSRQEKQITGWGHNVMAISVEGTFDDCQALVKKALNDVEVKKQRLFISANSINIGRLLPQMISYSKISNEHFLKTKEKTGFIIPSGNLGHSMAAIWARHCGFPISDIVLATNANSALSSYLQTGQWLPKPTLATLANAMDVGSPSNIERLFDLYSYEEIKKFISSYSCDDEQIQKEIVSVFKETGKFICPHTATAFYARKQVSEKVNWVIVSTAHPAKFETVVEPLVQEKIKVPSVIQKFLDEKNHRSSICKSDYSIFKKILLA